MLYGIRRMSMLELDEALEVARMIGAYAMAERLAAEIEQPGQLYVYPNCQECNGTGTVEYIEHIARPCDACHGNGYVRIYGYIKPGFPLDRVMDHLETGSGPAWV